MTQTGRWGLLLVAAAALLLPRAAMAGQSYSRGQNASPAYEGWEEDADGSQYFLFGYLNRNWEEVLDVPVGPSNYLEPGEADQGQPTHFLPRRNRFVFRVPVPDDFSDTDELVWTLTTKGKEEKAYATLRLDYFVDDLVKASEQGAIGAGTTDPVIRANRVPELEVEGDAHRTVRVGEPLTLVPGRATTASRSPGLGTGTSDGIETPGHFPRRDRNGRRPAGSPWVAPSDSSSRGTSTAAPGT